MSYCKEKQKTWLFFIERRGREKMSSIRENGALHAINTLRLASQLSGSCSELYETDKKNQPMGKIELHHAYSKKKKLNTEMFEKNG